MQFGAFGEDSAFLEFVEEAFAAEFEGGFNPFFEGMPSLDRMPTARGDTTVLYSTLGVNSDAKGVEIKKAYRKLAMKHHPDKGGDAAKFQQVTRAYEVLSDTTKRTLYDAVGLEGLRAAEEEGNVEEMAAATAAAASSNLHQPRAQRREEAHIPKFTVPKPQAIPVTLRCTLEELYTGTTTSVSVKRAAMCESCDGSGMNMRSGSRMRKCPSCLGAGATIGRQQVGPFVEEVLLECEACEGEGVFLRPQDRCRRCDGDMMTKQAAQVEVTVPRGTQPGSRLTVEGAGDRLLGAPQGDVIVRVLEIPHDRFTRKGDDLLVEHQMYIRDALCGVDFSFTHLDGRVLRIRSEPGVVMTAGSTQCVEGEGMPRKANPFLRGNLIVKFSLCMPERLTAAQVRLVKLAFPRPGDPKPGVTPTKAAVDAGTKNSPSPPKAAAPTPSTSPQQPSSSGRGSQAAAGSPPPLMHVDDATRGTNKVPYGAGKSASARRRRRKREKQAAAAAQAASAQPPPPAVATAAPSAGAAAGAGSAAGAGAAGAEDVFLAPFEMSGFGKSTGGVFKEADGSPAKPSQSGGARAGSTDAEWRRQRQQQRRGSYSDTDSEGEDDDSSDTGDSYGSSDYGSEDEDGEGRRHYGYSHHQSSAASSHSSRGRGGVPSYTASSAMPGGLSGLGNLPPELAAALLSGQLPAELADLPPSMIEALLSGGLPPELEELASLGMDPNDCAQM